MTYTKESRKRDKERTCRSILEAARELFLQNGFAAVTTKEIALKAEVNHSLIHYHFGSKRKLWEAIKQQMFEVSIAEGEGLGHTMASKQKLLEYVEWRARYIDAHPEFVRLLLWAILESGDSDADAPKSIRPRVLNMISSIVDAQRAGEIRKDINPILLYAFVLSATSDWMHWRSNWLLSPKITKEYGEITFDDYLNSLKSILTHGVFEDDRT